MCRRPCQSRVANASHNNHCNPRQSSKYRRAPPEYVRPLSGCFPPSSRKRASLAWIVVQSGSCSQTSARGLCAAYVDFPNQFHPAVAPRRGHCNSRLAAANDRQLASSRNLASSAFPRSAGDVIAEFFNCRGSGDRERIGPGPFDSALVSAGQKDREHWTPAAHIDSSLRGQS